MNGFRCEYALFVIISLNKKQIIIFAVSYMIWLLDIGVLFFAFYLACFLAMFAKLIHFRIVQSHREV